ncbi:MAG: hypothetical protein RLZZ204_208, partial [Bacteroidota bacterium]
EQQYIVDHIPGAKLEILDSFYGHDGFLLENEKLNIILSNLLKQQQ